MDGQTDRQTDRDGVPAEQSSYYQCTLKLSKNYRTAIKMCLTNLSWNNCV